MSEPAGRLLDQRPRLQPLHARRPVGVLQARLECRRIEPHPGAPQCRNREPGILHLMRAGEFRQRQVEQAVIVLIDKPPALGEGHVFAAVAEKRGAGGFRLELDHRQRMLVLRGDDARQAALQDAGFLRGDSGEVGAEELCMIMADRSDHRGERRLHDIGRVKPAAKPHFEQAEIRRVAGVEMEGDGRRHLEEGDRIAAVGA